MAKKKKKKRVLKIKNIIIFLIIVISIISIIYYAIKMPIKNIYISGNIILSDNIIINEAKLDSYPPFLLTPSYKIKKNLEKNNYIKEVKIKKKLGNIIEIEIEEHKAITIKAIDNQLILSNGQIVENIYNQTDIPILNNDITPEIFNNFTSKFSQIDRNILRQISQIEYSPVTVDNSRFLLYMNDGNLVYITLTKIDKINKYNEIKDKMSNQKGTIYLDSGDYIELKNNNPTNNDQDDTSIDGIDLNNENRENWYKSSFFFYTYLI